MEECIEWWVTWLELEDQMPNEATIVHRIVVMGNIYKDEYVPDMEVFGTAPPLSIQRWTALRKEALRQLSVEWFGLDQNDPKGKKPKVPPTLTHPTTNPHPHPIAPAPTLTVQHRP